MEDSDTDIPDANDTAMELEVKLTLRFYVVTDGGSFEEWDGKVKSVGQRQGGPR